MDGFDRALIRPGVLLCALACLSVAVCLAFASGTSAHEEDDDGIVVVHVTDEVFEPRSVEIEAGTRVVFENVGGEGHWPASDDHPTHEAYSAFDAREPIEPGEEWGSPSRDPGGEATTTI